MLKKNFLKGKAIQLIKDVTSYYTRNAVDFYLDMSPVSHQHYCDMMSHLWVMFQTGKMFNLVMSSFYSHEQRGKALEDNFGDE